jgi:predicted nucleotidyltransferase
MRREETLQLLQNHKAELVKQFGVVRLALFGSTVRDAASPGSDIDILIAFDGPATSKR